MPYTESTKFCTKCLSDKPRSDFRRRKASPDGLQAWCKICTAAYQKANQSRNTPKMRLYFQTRRHQARLFVLDYWKTHPCVDCGESDPRCLQFDHINAETKSESVSVLIAKGVAIPKILEEINKCLVRCANCHARKTSDELGFYTSKPEYRGQDFTPTHPAASISAAERGLSRKRISREFEHR